MEVDNYLHIVINWDLEFSSVSKINSSLDGTSGFIYFDNSHKLTNISDKNLIGDGYIDLYYGKIYWRRDKYSDYKKYSDGVLIEDYNYNMSYAKITSYPTDTKIIHNDSYRFWSEDVSSGFETDDEGNSSVITSVTNTTTIEVINYKVQCQEKQQVRPSDNSQDWVDTQVVRDKDCETEIDSCECGRIYQWIEVGEICDGANRCKKLKYQYKDGCDGSWIDYSPALYKIGDVIEMDSPQCGTYEYKEEWDDNIYCGSEINNLYGTNLTKTSKYKIKYPYIKKVDEFVWEKLDCDTLLGYEVVRTNSFECGWSSGKTEYLYEDVCWDKVLEKYPSLSGQTFNSGYSYNIRTTNKYVTAPYPTNTDDMTEDEWVWDLTATTYNVNSYKTSCDCGYRTTSWVTGDTVYCGSELVNTIIGADRFQITSVEGDWYNNGNNVFTSKHIKDSEMSILKINFTMATSGSVTVDYNISSESGDYIYFGYIDSATTDNYRTRENGGSSNNGYSSTVTYSNVSAGSHTLWIWYKQDSSGRSGRDNATLYLYSSYSPFFKYKIAEEYKYCSGTYYEKTGNNKLVSYSSTTQVECDCGWSSVNYYLTDETECGYNLGEGYVDTTEYTKVQGYKYDCSTSGISSSDTTSLSEHIINDMYWWSATTTNSYECGYKGENWVISGTVCCGKLDEEIGINSIEGLGTNSGEWYEQSDGVYSIYPLTSTGYSQTLIFRFTSNTDVKLIMGKTTGSTYVEFHTFPLDGDEYDATYTSTANTRTYTVNDDNEHTIKVRMYYRSSTYLKYLPTVQLQVASCDKYGLYNLEYKTITTDGVNYEPVIPYEYRYGSLISGNSIECDYIPPTYQWVAICEDITFETANTTKDESNDYVDVDGCSVCQYNSGYYQLYRLQKKQVSYDFGETWSDVIPIEVRPDELLGTDGQNGKGYKCSDEPTE